MQKNMQNNSLSDSIPFKSKKIIDLLSFVMTGIKVLAHSQERPRYEQGESVHLYSIKLANKR